MGKENIDSIMQSLERHASRVSRFSHVANGTKELSEEMLVDLGRLRVELNRVKSSDDELWVSDFRDAINDIRSQGEEMKAAGDEPEDFFQMYLDDANDLEGVLELMLDDKLEAAAKKAAHMDTAARENIPGLAWKVLVSY